MKVYLISVFLSIISFYLVLNKKEKKAILIAIFSIPIFYYPLENSKMHTGIKIGMTGLIFFSIWLGMILKRKNLSLRSISAKISYLYYFLFVGIFSGFIYRASGNYTFGGVVAVRSSPIMQIINNSFFIILVILVFKVLCRFQYDEKFLKKIADVFTFTIFLQVFSQTLKIVGFEHIMWGLFSSSFVFDIWGARNCGFWVGFGMGVYIVLIISFSLLYYNRHKGYSQLCIFFSFIYSLISGQRQTLVFVTIFFISLFSINGIRRKLSTRNIIIIISAIVMVAISWEPLIMTSVGYKRLIPAISLLNDGLILEASGRNIEGIPFVLEDLKRYPLTGKGSLDLGYASGSFTNIAGHVVWFNIYQKFGIIGVLFLFMIIVYPIIKLWDISLHAKNYKIFRESSILLSLMIIVFIQQFWDNFFAFSNTMILYAFIFFWVYSFFNRIKLNEKNISSKNNGE